MRSRDLFYRTSALALAAVVTFSAKANDGSYDSTFGNAGTGQDWIDVTSSTSDMAEKMILLPNGNLFMAGLCGITACAAWLTPAGLLATGYGKSGTGTASFSDFTGWPNDAQGAGDAAAFPDGRVAVVAGQSISSSYIALLKASGSGLDPSVGNGAGYVSTPFAALMVRLTAQQQLIVVGANSTQPEEIIVARYDSGFHLDTSFGTAGTTTIGIADTNTYPSGMTLQADGKIVVIGSAGSSPPALVIFRLTANGAADPDFGIDSDGKFESTFGNAYGAVGNDIVEDKRGRLVFAGFAPTDNDLSHNDGEWFVDRVLSGGAADAGFNSGQPQQFTPVDSSTTYGPRACCVALQSDNRIVVAGTMDRNVPAAKYFAIARFMDDGSFDSSFGGSGQSYGDMSPEAPNVLTDYPVSMVIVPGGIVVGGWTQVTTNDEVRFSAAKERIDLLFANDFE